MYILCNKTPKFSPSPSLGVQLKKQQSVLILEEKLTVLNLLCDITTVYCSLGKFRGFSRIILIISNIHVEAGFGHQSLYRMNLYSGMWLF